MVITAKIADTVVKRLLVDTGISCDVLFLFALQQMGIDTSKLEESLRPLVSFMGHEAPMLGSISLTVVNREEPKVLTTMVNLFIIDVVLAYNGILGQLSLNIIAVVVSTLHQMMKFPTWEGISQVCNYQKEARACYFIAIWKGGVVKACLFTRAFL